MQYIAIVHTRSPNLCLTFFFKHLEILLGKLSLPQALKTVLYKFPGAGYVGFVVSTPLKGHLLGYFTFCFLVQQVCLESLPQGGP